MLYRKVIQTNLKNNFKSVSCTQIRFMSAQPEVPDVEDHATGARKVELENEKLGKITYNRDALSTTEFQGTKENPIMVPSFNDVRPVGICHNDSSYLSWFNLKKGPVHYIPSVEKYFKLFNPSELQ